MLAVLHHLLVSERVPLPDLLNQAAELTSNLAVIEFVAPDDPMFRRIARGRQDLHRGLTLEHFEAACRKQFDIVRAERTATSSRWLYLLTKRR